MMIYFKAKILLLSMFTLCFCGMCEEIKIPISIKENGEISNWNIRAKNKDAVSGIKNKTHNAIGFNTQNDTIMLSCNKKIAISDFIKVILRAKFKGQGTIQIGFHTYSSKGYCATFPYKKFTIDSPEKTVILETTQLLGEYSDGTISKEYLPKYAFACIYAFPKTKGEIWDFSLEIEPFEPKKNTVINPLKNSSILPHQHRLLLDDNIYAVEGVESNVYFDNVFLSINPNAYVFDVNCTKGNNLKRRWSFTPKKNDVGTHEWTLSVIGENGIVAKKKINLIVSPANVTKDKEISLLMVGDSITNLGTFPKHVYSLFGKSNNPELTMIGTRQVTLLVKHEGYPGWTWGDFLEIGPFMFPKDGKLQLNIEEYFVKHNNGNAPDFITIQLGVNDIFNNDDYRIYNGIYHVEKNMTVLIDAFRKAAPNAIIGIGLTTPCASQDGIGRIYRCGQTKYQYTKNRFMLSELILRKYGASKDKKIFVIPMHYNLDCKYHFPTDEYPVNAGSSIKVSMPKDGLHPTPDGEKQLGDSLFAWLKFHLEQEDKK